jgi:hypothetical protein
LASGDDDPLTLAPVREALRENQVEKAKLEQRLVELRARHEEPVHLPSPDEVRQTVFDLETATMTDPTGARAVLARLFKDGIITLEPQGDRRC